MDSTVALFPQFEDLVHWCISFGVVLHCITLYCILLYFIFIALETKISL